MIKDVRISSVQLSVLIMGFLLGSTSIINVASGANQDAWLAFSMGWVGGFILMGMYVYISLLNPSKTLVEMLKDAFGRCLGSAVAVLYIWYFIHLASLVLRNFGEYLVTAIFPETPIIFVIICFALVIAYAVKSGLEVIARMSEVFVPFVPFMLVFIFLLLLSQMHLNYLFPFLEKGFKPVIKSAFAVLSFPFGETVCFLMIFPHLNKRNNLVKIAYLSLAIMGFIILSTVFQNLWVLGGKMVANNYFPSQTVSELIPNIHFDQIIAINLLIGGGVKICICMYAAVMGIAQLFNLEDYKPFVLPTVTIIIALSIWVYDNLFEMFYWAVEIWPYYSVPFQIVIPLLLLIISWIKQKRKQYSRGY